MWTKIKQILALRQEVDDLKKQMAVMCDEWQDWFDRFKRLHARIARRQQRDEQALEREDTQPGEGTLGVPTSLSPRAQQVQREILELRQRRMNGGH